MADKELLQLVIREARMSRAAKIEVPYSMMEETKPRAIDPSLVNKDFFKNSTNDPLDRLLNRIVLGYY